MVLIRKQYFREHCESVMREHREKRRIRGVWNRIAKHSFRRAASEVPGLKVEEEPISPGKPIVAADEGIAAALAAGAGVGLGVGLGDKPFQDAVFDERVSQNPLEEESLTVGKHPGQGVLASPHSFTSSPRTIGTPFQPLSPTSWQGDPAIRWDEQSQQARTDRNYMRKRASTSSLVLYGFGLTVTPARQFTMMTQNTVVPGPPRRKDQDMGGFPGPIELFQRLMHANTFGFVNRAWNRIAAYGQNHGQHRYLSWLPDGLVIGRNSEFYTDELTDEQLERLGGIEYRALRFLSYFIFAVSPEVSRH